MADLASDPELIERLRQEASKQQIRELLANAYAFVHSRNQLDLALTRSVDDYRDRELEQIEGAEDPNNPLILHTQRRLSDVVRVEQIRLGVLAAIEALTNNPDLTEEDQ